MNCLASGFKICHFHLLVFCVYKQKHISTNEAFVHFSKQLPDEFWSIILFYIEKICTLTIEIPTQYFVVIKDICFQTWSMYWNFRNIIFLSASKKCMNNLHISFLLFWFCCLKGYHVLLLVIVWNPIKSFGIRKVLYSGLEQNVSTGLNMF